MRYRELNKLLLPTLFKKIFLILVLLTPLKGYTQSWMWDTGFNGFFDNREFFNDYVEPQTMFGSHFFAYTGFSVNENSSFYGGGDLLFESGGKLNEESFSPILFFEHKKDFLQLRMGSFPRHGLVELPLFMHNDTLQYYRPNLQGIFIEAKKKWGFQNTWLDWTSRQTDTERETFQIGGSGGLKFGPFFYRHDFIMTHYAGPAIPIPDDHIRDNGGLSARIGLQFSDFVLDSISVSTGYCYSYDRMRNLYDTRFYEGNLIEIYLEYYQVAIKTSHYFGDGQVQIGGDAAYSAPKYHRVDFLWDFFRRPGLDGRVKFSFHWVDGVFEQSQALTIYAQIGGQRKIKRPDRN